MTERTFVAPAPDAPHEEKAGFWSRLFRFAITEAETIGHSSVMNLIPEPERGLATVVVDFVSAAAAASSESSPQPGASTASPTPAPTPVAPPRVTDLAPPVAPTAPAVETPAPVVPIAIVSDKHVDTEADVDAFMAELSTRPNWPIGAQAWMREQIKERIGDPYTLAAGVRNYENAQGSLDVLNPPPESFYAPSATPASAE